MQVVINIPDQFARDLVPEGTPPEQALLEQAVVGAFREGRLTTTEQVRVLLGLGTRMQAMEVLGRHGVELYTAADFEQDMATMDQLLAAAPK